MCAKRILCDVRESKNAGYLNTKFRKSLYFLLKRKSEVRSDLHAAYCPYSRKALIKTECLFCYVVILAFTER